MEGNRKDRQRNRYKLNRIDKSHSIFNGITIKAGLIEGTSKKFHEETKR